MISRSGSRRERLRRRRMKRLRFASLLSVFVFIGLGGTYILYDKWSNIADFLGITPLASCVEQKQTMQKPEVGLCAPDFELKDPTEEDELIRLYQNDEKLSIVYFWSSSCGSCQKELAYLSQKYKQYEEKFNFLIIHAASVEPDPTQAESWMKQQKYEFPMLTEPKKPNVSIDKYQLPGLPTTFIIDKNGRIIHKIMGSFTKSQFDNMLKGISA